MLDPALLPRIQTHLTRFAEIETLLGDPDIAADQKRFVKLTKEYKHLGSLDKLMKRYNEEKDNITFYHEMIEVEEDPAEVEAAKNAIVKSEDILSKLEDDIKLFLSPNDPEDDKNAILEIRAGTGGD